MAGDRRARRYRTGVDGGPLPFGQGLDEVVDRLVPPSPAAVPPRGLGEVFSRWDEIAGPVLARHARLLRVSSEELVIVVDEPAWATEVRSLGGDLLRRVGEVAGASPARLRVTVRTPREGS